MIDDGPILYTVPDERVLLQKQRNLGDKKHQSDVMKMHAACWQTITLTKTESRHCIDTADLQLAVD